MRLEICPCCGLRSFEYWNGEHDIPDEHGFAKQLSPDTARCIWCGYDWSEGQLEGNWIKKHKLRYYKQMGHTIKENTEHIIDAVEGRQNE